MKFTKYFLALILVSIFLSGCPITVISNPNPRNPGGYGYPERHYPQYHCHGYYDRYGLWREYCHWHY